MEIKSDIQIAQEAHLENIKDVAAKECYKDSLRLASTGQDE